MYKQQGPNKMECWINYAPLLYTHLIIHPALNLTGISNIKWLRGLTNIKYLYSYPYLLSNFTKGQSVLLVLPIKSPNQITKKEGQIFLKYFFQLVQCSVPVAQQLDDNRLKPFIKLRSQWSFQEQINLFEQYGNNLQDADLNNMFAISYKNLPVISLLSTRKLLDEGMHIQYVDFNCIKLRGHKSPITDLKWANLQANGHKVFSSSYDSTIIQWDVEKIVLQRELKYHKSSVQAITPIHVYNQGHVWGDGPTTSNMMNVLASVSTDGNLFIWDHKSPTPVSKINPKQKQLYSIQCLSESLLLSGGLDGSIKLWDLRTFRQYLYQSKFDKPHGHSGKVREIKVNRYVPHNKKHNKSGPLGNISFSTSGDDGKVIQWEQKFYFSHQGHQGPATFDISEEVPLTVSADIKKNYFMIWKSGISMNQTQI